VADRHSPSPRGPGGTPTEHHTSEGKVYCCAVKDVFSNRIVGYSIADRMKSQLAVDALNSAVARRGRRAAVAGCVVHSDRGSPNLDQGSSCALWSPAGWSDRWAGSAPYDNALMETINGLYKAEAIRTTVFHRGPYKTIADVEYATAGWVDWYNNRRLHSTLGHLVPVCARTIPTKS